MNRKPTPPDGLVIVDKPSGFTSHDVVAKMRGIAKTRRVGHAGTLDPMATGVLVLGIEKATKLLGHLALTEELSVMPIADAAAAAFPRWNVDAKRARLLLNGVRLEMPDEYACVGAVAVFDPEGRFLALVEEQKGKAKSLAVLG